APIANAADIHVAHPRLPIVPRRKRREKPLQLFEENRIVEPRLPRAVGTDGLAVAIMSPLGARLLDPARRRILLLDAIRAGLLATDPEGDAQSMRSPLFDDAIDHRPIELALAGFEIRPR